jgi:AcrR family transcriptional regulator
MTSESTKARLLKAGLDMLSQDGLSGLSIGRVAEATGLSKSGMFAHVHSKEQLEINLLDAGTELAGRTVIAPAMETRPGLTRLRVLIDRWLGWSSRAGLNGGCPVAAALFELDDRPGPVRDHVAILERQWHDLLASLTAEAVDRGEFRDGLDIEQFIFELCGIYLSHHTASRFFHDPLARERAGKAVDVLIARAGGPATPIEEARS